MPHLDAGLADGDGLLLHGLVNGHLIAHIHLVKLVNAADAVVSKHQRASLNRKLAALRVLARGSSSIAGSREAASVICITVQDSSTKEGRAIQKRLSNAAQTEHNGCT
jgi:hypothetical protein